MQGTQPEVAEAVVPLSVDEGVEAVRVQAYELGRAVGDQALPVSDGDRAGERRDALGGGLGADADREQTGGQPRVEGVLGDEAGGRLGGQLAQLRLVGPRGAAAQRGGGDPPGVGAGEVGGQLGQGPQQRGSGAVGFHRSCR
ncbi:hypothetical protein SALBM311S_11771 [Streptomyces alboniger]